MPSFEKNINNFCSDIKEQIFGTQVNIEKFPTSYYPCTLRVDGKGNFYLINTSQRSTWKGRIISLIQWFVYGNKQKACDNAMKKALNQFEENFVKTALSGKNIFSKLNTITYSVYFFQSDPDFSKDAKLVDSINNFHNSALNRLFNEGSGDVLYGVGCCYINDNNGDKAFKWFQKAAEKGNINAEIELGKCYEKGIGVDIDNKTAFNYFYKAGCKGSSRAQRRVAHCYHRGIGVDRDPMLAFVWYQSAAEEGDAEAQYKTGLYYEKGRIVKKNLEEALEWYIKAADKGLTRAKNALKIHELNKNAGQELKIQGPKKQTRVRFTTKKVPRTACNLKPAPVSILKAR